MRPAVIIRESEMTIGIWDTIGCVYAERKANTAQKAKSLITDH